MIKTIGQEVVMSFPQEKTIVKIVSLPAHSPGEIEEMLKLQAPLQVPLDPAETVMDYHILETDSQGTSRVLVAIVRKQDLEEALASLGEKRDALDRIVLDSLLSLPLLRRTRPSEGYCLVVEILERSVTLAVFKADALLGTRSAPKRDIVQEIKKTILAHAPCPMPGPDLTICIAGEGACGPALQEEIRQKWGASVHIAVSGPAADWELPVPNGHAFNLLPEKERRKKTQIDLQKKLFSLAGRGSVIAAIVAFLIGGGFYAKHRQLQKLDAAALALVGKTQELKREAAKLHAVESHMNEQNSFLSALAELNRLVPEHVSMQSVDFERARSLLLQGTCFTLAEAVHVAEVLQKSPVFSKVELRTSNVRRSHDRDLVDFVIACQLHT